MQHMFHEATINTLPSTHLFPKITQRNINILFLHTKRTTPIRLTILTLLTLPWCSTRLLIKVKDQLVINRGRGTQNDWEHDGPLVHFSKPAGEFKLPADLLPGCRNESSKPQRVPKICPLPRELRRVLRAGHHQEVSTAAELVASEFRNPKASFLVEPGSD